MQDWLGLDGRLRLVKGHRGHSAGGVRVSRDENLWPRKEDLGGWDGARSIGFLFREFVLRTLLPKLLPWAGARTWPSKAVRPECKQPECKGIAEGKKARACRHDNLTPGPAFELVF